ncbi:MAG TPA: hypothetical protein VMA09_20670 [Candidatus Binataceae bacterium]|nr:hypothetical protein [Candidatus Binataceae bacterium]
MKILTAWLLALALGAASVMPSALAPGWNSKAAKTDTAFNLLLHGGRRPVRALPHQDDSSGLSLQSESGPERSIARSTWLGSRLVSRLRTEAVHVIAASPQSLAFLCCLRI